MGQPDSAEVEPEEEPNDPAAHTVHSVDEVAPSVEDQLPAGHSAVTVGSVQYKPAAQSDELDEPAGQWAPLVH